MYAFFIPLYDITFILISVKYIIRYAFRKRLKKYLFQRFSLPRETKQSLNSNASTVWIHAVSVGEVKSLSKIFKELQDKYPLKQFVISVVTDQGKYEADRLYSEKAVVFYLPVDISFIIKDVVNFVNPDIFVVVETEIWPNLYYFLDKKNIPIVMLNARISDESFKFYKLAAGFIKQVLKRVDFVAAQDLVAEKRFSLLGVEEELLEVTGNMKYESLEFDIEKLNRVKDKWLHLKDRGQMLVIAGSTHFPEENIVADMYQEFLSRKLKISLLICPRHLERVSGIEKSMKSKGLIPVRVSQYRPALKDGNRGKEVYILDTMGELAYFYSIADIVFVGGSLAQYGGHNILEPAYFKKPVLVGPHTFNFKDIISDFLENKAVIQVKSGAELRRRVVCLMNDEDLREELGINARNIIEKSKESVYKNMNILAKFIEFKKCVNT